MWKYNNTNELCHYGVIGMKWGIRRNLYNYYDSLSNLTSNKLNKYKKSYELQKKNDSKIKESKSKIGNSKLFTAIRSARMIRTQAKIEGCKGILKASKEGTKILKKQLSQYSKAEIAKTKMKIAKKMAISSKKQTLVDVYNSNKLLADKSWKDLAKYSKSRSKKLYNDYLQKKREYKKLKSTL